MKKILIVVGLIIAVILVMPNINNQNIRKNINQIDYLFSLRNEYIGNASANGKIIQTLQVSQLGDCTLELKTNKPPYILTINFSDIKVNANELNTKMKQYSIILLALIDNVDEIRWNIGDEGNNHVNIDEVNKEYGNIKDYGKSVKKLHSLLIDIGYLK